MTKGQVKTLRLIFGPLLPTPFLLSTATMGLYVLDYGAGNVQSLANTLKKLDKSFKWIKEPADFAMATVSPQLGFRYRSSLTRIKL